jgi:uncharacterized membrane protein YgcG
LQFFSLSTLFEVVFALGPLRGLFYTREFNMMATFSARALLLSLALGAAPAFALPLMDMRADDLLAIAPEFSKSLNMTPNQLTLWRQVEGRSRAILRERQLRRERMQLQARTQLDGANVELRDLGAALDAEAAASSAEDKQLRELWLTVNDALDDKQRHQVAAFVADQMMRVPDSAVPHRAPQDEGEGGGHGRGGAGHGKRGGGMGGGTSR